MLAVLMNDKSDPLGFGQGRKTVDELYGFGATAVFHDSERETPNEYGCHVNGAFPGAIYRTLRTIDGEEVQDRAFNLATHGFHYPKTGLVSLRSATKPPVAYQSSGVQGAPRWRHYVAETPVDPTGLFPLHNPLNYVRWLGTQKKRLVVLAKAAGASIRRGRGRWAARVAELARIEEGGRGGQSWRAALASAVDQRQPAVMAPVPR